MLVEQDSKSEENGKLRPAKACLRRALEQHMSLIT